MSTETQQATDTSISLEDNKTTAFDETVVSKQRLKAAEDLDTNVAKKPVHGEDGECCGGCGG